MPTPPLAPVILFTFNRPEHTRRTLEALAANTLAGESDLTIYCDGPRGDEDLEAVRAVREIAAEARGFRSIRVVERETNQGLARSLIGGIDDALTDHPAVIVLEDDLVTSPHFLRFMNEGLARFADDDRVMSVSGYAYPVEGPTPEAYLMPRNFCWGWATWRRGWALYERDAEALLVGLIEEDLVYELDFEGTDPMSTILQWTVNRIAGVDSWASRWIASGTLHDRLTLYPGRTLVQNIGFDGSGLHAKFRVDSERFASPPTSEAIELDAVEPVLDRRMIEVHRRMFRRWHGRGGPLATLYFRLSPFLPRRLDRALYTHLARRRLRLQANPAVRAALAKGRRKAA